MKELVYKLKTVALLLMIGEQKMTDICNVVKSYDK